MYINVRNVPITTFIYTYLHLYTVFYIYIHFPFSLGIELKFRYVKFRIHPRKNFKV